MTLKVGDVCEVVGSDHFPDMIGKIVTIFGGPYRIKDTFTNERYIGYEVIVEGQDFPNKYYMPKGKYLRKLPPKQGTTTWEDIQHITGWVPNKQGVES